jgi:uncharacterized protein (TIGR00369 family)
VDGFAGWIGIAGTTSGQGRARLELKAEERHLNPAGTLHGGVLATLVDTAMGQAVRSVIDGQTPATSQLTIAYLKPGSEGRLVASAEVRRQGEQVLVCEAGVEQDGDLLVTALATFALVQR